MREPDAGLAQAENFLAVAQEFNVERVWTMSPPEDIPPLRERFGPRLGFNGLINKKPDEPDDVAYRLLDRFLAEDVKLIKFWASPRAEGDSLFLRDVPWRAEVIRRASAAGVRVAMVHVADPDKIWFQHRYTDRDRYGTKAEHYAGLEWLIQEFPNIRWIAAHMGVDPENPDCLEELLDLYANLSFDTSATKWQVREMSLRSQRMKRLVCRYPDRFLFGSGPRHSPRSGAGALCQPVLVSVHPAGKRLAGSEPDRGLGLEAGARVGLPGLGRAQFACRGAGASLSRQRTATLAVMERRIGGCRGDRRLRALRTPSRVPSSQATRSAPEGRGNRDYPPREHDVRNRLPTVPPRPRPKPG